MATTLTTLPDFIVTIDRAGHLVVDLVSEIGNVLRSIDFGGAGCETSGLVYSWLKLDDESRDAMAPAVNAFLVEHFNRTA